MCEAKRPYSGDFIGYRLKIATPNLVGPKDKPSFGKQYLLAESPGYILPDDIDHELDRLARGYSVRIEV